MPWKETCPMKERSRFVVEQESGRYAMAELCRIFGMSRETGYKWVARHGRDIEMFLLMPAVETVAGISG